MGDLLMNTNESIRSVILTLEIGYDHEENALIESSRKFVKGLGYFFYIVQSDETIFEKVEDVPNYFKNAWPYFLLFIILENILLWIEKKPIMRINDGITSLSLGLAHECAKLVFKALEGYCYIWVYAKFRILDLPWNSSMTWFLAALSMDFFYYWGHRASHEIHILWAQHQVHHSSEEFNTAVALRQSILQGYSFLFYLPMALIIPPSLFITHQHFNLLYQFWIHTEVVKSLGVLEYIFNTPQHHRVHHGSNIWCLDKNYGGVLIIWDRIFGTFASEKKNEEIIYGLVVNKPSFNPLQLQTFYTAYVFRKFNEMKTWKLKYCALFFGPSWRPGSPRLGFEEEKIKVGPRTKYNVEIPVWCNIYILVHFVLLVFGYHKITSCSMDISPLTTILFVIYILGSLTSIGMLFDNHPYACIVEVLRCMILVVTIQKLELSALDENVSLAMEVIFLSSGLFWFIQSMNVLHLIDVNKLHRSQ